MLGVKSFKNNLTKYFTSLFICGTMSLQVKKTTPQTSAREEQNKMKVTRLKQKATDKYITEVIEYSSLSEFYDYIMNTPFNKTFEHHSHSSVTGSKEFTKTYTFEEAVGFLKNGWVDMSAKLTQKLNVADKNLKNGRRPRTILSVQGYQAVVPLYLNGCPQNMVNSKMVSVKQKIITLNKSVTYSALVTTRQIEDESVKAMQIVKRLESQGYRCNLNIVLGVFKGTRRFIVKVRIKNANEKLNVSKLAFPMVHPSMLRRLFFRFIEVYPKVTSVFSYGYGQPVKGGALREFLDKKEILLPDTIVKDVNKITSVEDLENL